MKNPGRTISNMMCVTHSVVKSHNVVYLKKKKCDDAEYKNFPIVLTIDENIFHIESQE